MPEPVRVIGSYISPYVRKVLVCLNIKQVPYEIDPIIPFMGADRFSALSPLRRVPVLIDDLVTLSDSTVICQYLEERYPEPSLYPLTVADRARARWLEEFADTRMGDVFIWRLFNQVVIRPFVWGEPANKELVSETLIEHVPRVLDYLEAQVPADGFCFGTVSIADISIASFFRNAALARYRIDAARWPKTAALVERTLALPAFAALRPFEDKLARTPVAEHRTALELMGAPLSAETVGTTQLRRGVMPTS
jgi:glutathione S-transferase